MRLHAFAAAVACITALAGCGLKGPLYLPEKPGEVVTRPGPTSQQPATTGTGTAPPPLPPAPGDRTGG